MQHLLRSIELSPRYQEGLLPATALQAWLGRRPLGWSSGKESSMEFGILGPLDVVGGTRIISLPRGRGRALLALLILNAGRVVSTDRLVDELWGQQPPATAATALQGLVSKLRKRLEPTQTPTVLITREPGYVLAVDPD
ncbi:MAG: helix-turn-helix domain-containing protein, partial [Actinobacteria bacterium]|nr:helix-turn-helix domain-containing protein [Actinomycetota bacterium]